MPTLPESERETRAYLTERKSKSEAYLKEVSVIAVSQSMNQMLKRRPILQKKLREMKTKPLLPCPKKW